MWGEAALSKEKKAIIYICNRMPNPQGLLMGARLYNTLTGDKGNYRKFVAAAKMLVEVEDGSITRSGSYVQLGAHKSTKHGDPVNRLLKQISRKGTEFGFVPGIKYMQTAYATAENSSGTPPLKEVDGAW